MYYMLMKTIDRLAFENDMTQLGIKKKDYSYCIFSQGARKHYDFYQLCIALCKSEITLSFDSNSLSIYRINSDAITFYLTKRPRKILVLAKVDDIDFFNERQAYLTHELNKALSYGKPSKNQEKLRRIREMRKELSDSVS